MEYNEMHLSIKNIVVAEDHELFGDGILLLLQELFPAANVSLAADFNMAWIALNQSNIIDLLLMDLKMPGTKGLSGVRAVKQAFPSLVIVVLSSLDSAINVERVMGLGVNGFISKGTSKEKMKQAILSILQGNIVTEAPRSELTVLSRRQQQTLCLMAQGKSNKEIAKILAISPNTAKEYVSIVIAALSVKNRTQAVQKAEHLGLLFDSH